MYVDQEFEVNIQNTSLLFNTHRENISCNFLMSMFTDMTKGNIDL